MCLPPSSCPILLHDARVDGGITRAWHLSRIVDVCIIVGSRYSGGMVQFTVRSSDTFYSSRTLVAVAVLTLELFPHID